MTDQVPTEMKGPLTWNELRRKYRLYGDTPNVFDSSLETGSMQRHVDGLAALLLSLKKKPIIRYERMSNMAKKLGQELQVRPRSSILVQRC